MPAASPGRSVLDERAAPLSTRHQEVLADFVGLWGEMASAWGINRSMAQLFALLYASDRPLDTDEIMERLQISRGNANTNLRALVDWRLIERTTQPGSRKDYYLAEKDVWKITSIIIEERRRREIQPVQHALAGGAERLRSGDTPLSPREVHFAERMEALVRFLDVFEGFTGALLPFLHERNVTKVQKLIRFARRLRRDPSANA
jgi:DNA-binding transcriptional regulator GbsR (MarR family)